MDYSFFAFGLAAGLVFFSAFAGAAFFAAFAAAGLAFAGAFFAVAAPPAASFAGAAATGALPAETSASLLFVESARLSLSAVSRVSIKRSCRIKSYGSRLLG